MADVSMWQIPHSESLRSMSSRPSLDGQQSARPWNMNFRNPTVYSNDSGARVFDRPTNADPHFGRPLATGDDHTLRRKTPHGTINAAFQSSVYPSGPTKHPFRPAACSFSQPFQFNYVPHHDSMTFSMTGYPLQYVNPLAQNAATVIQLPNQPYGPTASGSDGQGPYGPYWHDGTFVPYMPHPIRDPRYHAAPYDPRAYRSHNVFDSFHLLDQTQPQLYSGSPGPWPNSQSGHLSPHATASSTSNCRLRSPGPGVVPTSRQDRDRIFDSSLAIYRDLLGSILDAKRNRIPGQAFQPQPQPGIFPKPPSSLTKPLLPPIEHERRPSVSQGALTSIPSDQLPITSLAGRDTAWLRAHHSLKRLEQLCHSSGWQWIDGVNLSGCLAYALTDYKKAFKLYKHVLQLEPSHVEAKANLAATSLALGRPAEAERYWREAVNQAPDHFEAVEHLVGLLCSTGRGQDAVKIINHIQDRLLLLSKGAAPDSSSAAHESMSVNERTSHDTSWQPRRDSGTSEQGFGSSGYAIPGTDNGRMLALIHAKGNLMYSQGDFAGAASAFEDVVLIATGRHFESIGAVVDKVISVISPEFCDDMKPRTMTSPVLLRPEQALQVAQLCFPQNGNLPGLTWVPSDNQGLARRGALLTTSNSLLSLAKILQDGMSSAARRHEILQPISGVREILALYYLSLSIHPSPSTANNVGILLAGVQQPSVSSTALKEQTVFGRKINTSGTGITLALAYYSYGLVLDSKHAHLYTNLGSLLKDIGQLDAAVEMYNRAVQCDPKFDIALANLANAVKDKGRISDAISYYYRAVEVNPDFAEAICGLSNALSSVCKWAGRGGIVSDGGKRDRWHVDNRGMLFDATNPSVVGSGWIKRVVDIVEKQLREGEHWGVGCLEPEAIVYFTSFVLSLAQDDRIGSTARENVSQILASWSGKKNEGARVLRLVERVTRHINWLWYRDKYASREERGMTWYKRPQLPDGLMVPVAPTVLPFHTFTCPLSSKQIRYISQRNGYRISATALKSSWLPATVFSPPPPPDPVLRVGYVSSDFNNHPLAHLMQSVFGFHDSRRVEAHCYATTPSDNSVHRKQIESEAPRFVDVSAWSNEQLVTRIVADGIHILVNLNGYTRGARNEVFAARPAPLQMSFMGFAGTMGAEWCDYMLADSTSIPASTLRPMRRESNFADYFDDSSDDNEGSWVYGENIIYCRSTFFCCDHRQSAPDATAPRLTWAEEKAARWKMRSELFPNLKPDVVIFANFNQLYKIEPTTFRSWLRILAQVPNGILWLLRFPDLGEANLLHTARQWAGADVASRIIFTDVAPKSLHIARAKVVDLFLDTPECNAHTTAADVLWSGTPLLTYPRYEYKMCSRMAASILRGALPLDPDVRKNAERDLIAASQEEYEALAIKLGNDVKYPQNATEGFPGNGQGRLIELRQMLTEARWSSDLFDTRRWVADLEDGYEEAWRKWVQGRRGDIYLDQLPRGRIVS